jgi:hypothetical protein
VEARFGRGYGRDMRQDYVMMMMMMMTMMMMMMMRVVVSDF